MKNQLISIPYQEFSSVDELDSDDQILLNTAREVLRTAYAPYSNYLVGCALRLNNGVVVTGTNQENMAYPSGLCAERVALFYAGSAYPEGQIISMAICATPRSHQSDQPSASCGACRQVMLEYELKQEQPIRVLFQGMTGPILVVEKVKDLLPLFFREDWLKNG